jgi:prepilin-type N-terminal cleavage/methylation domain-containing protein/prepilin-type processing-associated H-X9-DG protein
MNPNAPAGKSVRRFRNGFTLVELVVVVALFAAFVIMLAPVLARTQPSTRSTRCLNNHRQLVAAWKMYAADNSDKLIYNFGVAQTSTEISNATYRNWANNNLDWTSSQLNTNVGLLSLGLFAPYLNRNTPVYKCPADSYVSSVQAALGWTARVRSISMNAYMGPYTPTYTSGANNFFPAYRQFLKSSLIPKPASLFVFLDEHPDSINDAYFLNNADPQALTAWLDLPASYHSGGCGFSFPDGHAEMILWKSSATRLPVRNAAGFPQVPFGASDGGTLDRDWITSHTSVRF